MSQQICVVPIEGVLSQGRDLKNAQPQRWARALYEGLHTSFRMIGVTANDPEIVDWWLRREMLRDWAGVLTQPDVYNDFGTWKVKQVEEFLSESWEVGLMIDIDGEVLEAVSKLGVVTMFLRYPANRVGWRSPETPVREWANVVESL